MVTNKTTKFHYNLVVSLIKKDSKTLVLARLWFLSSREERNPRRGAECPLAPPIPPYHFIIPNIIR